MRLVPILALLAIALLPTPRNAAAAEPRLRAVATTTMVADLVRAIGGPRVETAALMGPGVDPHLYKPTASDISQLRSADTIFYSGLHLEGRMTDLFEKMARSGRPVVAVTAAIPAERLLQSEKYTGLPDPHVWGDVSLWTLAIDPVLKTLSTADPAGTEAYRSRAETLRKELLALHDWAAQTLATIPEKNRTLVTSHDAFAYFGRAYGLSVVGVQGISTVTEAGLADMAKTVDLIKERGIKAIFVESSVPHNTIERISRDSGARIGGELFSDSLGTPGSTTGPDGHSYDPGTYIGMIKHNVSTVVEALK